MEEEEEEADGLEEEPGAAVVVVEVLPRTKVKVKDKVKTIKIKAEAVEMVVDPSGINLLTTIQISPGGNALSVVTSITGLTNVLGPLEWNHW